MWVSYSQEKKSLELNWHENSEEYGTCTPTALTTTHSCGNRWIHRKNTGISSTYHRRRSIMGGNKWPSQIILEQGVQRGRQESEKSTSGLILNTESVMQLSINALLKTLKIKPRNEDISVKFDEKSLRKIHSINNFGNTLCKVRWWRWHAFILFENWSIRLHLLAIAINASTQRYEQFRNLQTDSPNGEILSMIQDVKTRWGSTWCMLSRAHLMKDTIKLWLDQGSVNLKVMTLTRIELEQVKYIVDLLHPF